MDKNSAALPTVTLTMSVTFFLKPDGYNTSGTKFYKHIC